MLLASADSNTHVNGMANTNIATPNINKQNQTIQNTENSTQMASTSNQQNSQTPTNTYANKLKNTYPKKEQAIIINAINEIQTIEYIRKIGELTSPQNIIFASRISFNRICIYLSSKNLVDKIITNNKHINIGNYKLEIRRLITPALRITISNVCPSIPHQIIEEELTKLSIKTISQITFVRAGMQDPEYQHILSFRRQVFINEEDKNKIPESIFVEYENTSYKLYLSGDTIQCNICKKHGHAENKCHLNKEITETSHINKTSTPNQETVCNNTFTQHKPDTSNKQITNTEENNAVTYIADNNAEQPILQNTTTQKKRLASTLSNEETQNESPEENDKNESKNKNTDNTNTKTQPTLNANKGKNQEKTEKKNKKPRAESPNDGKQSIEDLLLPAKDEILNNPDKYPLPYETILDLIEEIEHSKDKLNTALNYTNNIPELIEMFQNIYQYAQHRSTKIKLTKIINSIKTQLIEEDDDDTN